jgi:hypothetical protein
MRKKKNKMKPRKKIFCRFVVHESKFFNKDATNYLSKAETNLWGRQTGESPAVLTGISGSCSDLPLLFNPNLFVMHEPQDELSFPGKDQGKAQDLPTGEVLNNFFSNYSPEEVNSFLWDWYVTALGSGDMDCWTAFDRSSLAMLYRRLKELITQLAFIHFKFSTDEK